MQSIHSIALAALLAVVGFSLPTADAQTKMVLRSKSILLTNRDASNRRYVCDGSVAPIRIGVFKSQNKTFTTYTRAVSGTQKRRATTECKRKISKRICGDGIDNDGDGNIDFPADTDCQSWFDASEDSPNPVPTSGATAIPVPPGGSPLSLFRSPLNGSFPLSNFFDHDVPEEFVDTNGYSRISTGELLTNNLDGHEGYDFDVPTGTPIVAVGDGEVEFGGLETPFFCPLLNKNTSGNFVRIRHDTSNGAYYSVYVHLSRVDVQAGQTVVAGTQIGLSGNTGCSTGPHLHFDIRQMAAGNKMSSVDPFGWSGNDVDPWTLKPAGLPSRFLWKKDQAPEIYRELRLAPNPNTGDAASIAITAIRSMGFNDSINPNNEFLELQIDPRFAPQSTIDLTGFYIVNNIGDRYNFPSGTILTQGTPLTVKIGTGTDTATTLYMNRSSGIFDNDGDCARLFRPSGFRLYYLFYGDKGCTGISGTRKSLRVPLEIRDAQGPSTRN